MQTKLLAELCCAVNKLCLKQDVTCEGAEELCRGLEHDLQVPVAQQQGGMDVEQMGGGCGDISKNIFIFQVTQ